MYRTQNLCHLCRQDITKVIKIKRSHGITYQKVIGILQRSEGKFYYSDVNKDLVKELKMYHKLNQPPREESECDIPTDLIDECVS